VLPSNHANWTQALLFDAVLRQYSQFQRVSALKDHGAFVDDDGTFLICGTDRRRMGAALLGLGEHRKIQRKVPAPMAGLLGVRVQSVATSNYHVLVLSVDGTTFSWGFGGSGALGHGDTEDVAQPKPIRALHNVSAIAASGGAAFSILSDGTLWSWGKAGAYDGILGHGDMHSLILLPQQIEALAGKRICAIASSKVSQGSAHALAACADGSCFSWGSNYAGQLGVNDHLSAHTPVHIVELSSERVSNVAAAESSSCVVTVQGTLWQFGLWDGVRCPKPMRLERTLLDGHRVVSVAIGFFHRLALTDDGLVFSWLDKEAHAHPIAHELIRKLGHGDHIDHAGEIIFTPKPIISLYGRRICSISIGYDRSSVAGWTQSAGDRPDLGGQVAEAKRPQWACWRWGSAPPGLPQRVAAIGANRSEQPEETPASESDSEDSDG
jgi:alpha-tubulin suppressor-like RCC1 family protein